MTTWRTLEQSIPLNDLPPFHRRFLEWRGVEGVAGMPLRRVGQRVEAELNRMVQEGKAVRLEGDWDLLEGALAGFEAASVYL